MRASAERPSRTLPALLLVLLGLLLVLTSLEKRLSWDEPYHLRYGYNFITRGPTVWDCARLPISLLSALPCLPTGCARSELDAHEVRRLWVRAPTMAFALGLGALFWFWLAETLGLEAARLGLILYVFNPTVLAHGKQVTTDMAVAFFTAASLYAAWRFAKRADWRPFAIAVLATAGAAVSKYTSLYLLGLVPALVMSCAWRRDATLRLRPRAVLRALGLTLAFVAGVVLVINCVYLFEGTFTPSRDVPFVSQPGRRVAAWNLPLPVPVVYALGIDYAQDVSERPWGFGPNYALGQRSWDAVWYGFPVMLLLKTPLAFFILLGLALFRATRPLDVPLWRFWLVPSFVHLAFFSFGVRPQMGIRYILPALVLLVPVAAAAARPCARFGTLLLAALAGWYVVSALSYLPHPMCYFNELIGRRIHAYRFLADSNLDWEDRGAAIARYQARHPELDIAVEPAEVHAGYVLVGANRLLGIGSDDAYRRLRRLEPIDHVGYSFLLFHVSAEDLAPRRARRKPD